MEHGLVVAKHQHMLVLAVTEVVVNALLFTQPLDEMQVGFRVLHAERPRRVDHRPQLKGVAVGQDAVVFEDCRDDLRNTALLENPLVASMGKVGETRRQCQVIAGEPPPGVVAANRVNLPVQAFIRIAKNQVGRLVEQ